MKKNIMNKGNSNLQIYDEQIKTHKSKQNLLFA